MKRVFFWGAATSAHQVEGGNNNDWTEWETSAELRGLGRGATRKETRAQQAAREAGKRPWPDYILKNYPNPLQEENYISGRACDHYKRFEEDFDIAKSLSHNAHRLSIEWSRIEPEEGKWNEKEIEHYREVIRALRERGLEPFVTLWHWTNPLWIARSGGWENPETIKYFVRYAKKMAGSLDGVNFWITVNEPVFYAGLGYLLGLQPPGKKSIFSANRAAANLIRAHKEAYDAIRARNPGSKIGFAHAMSYTVAPNNLPWNMLLNKTIDYFRNWRPLNKIGGKTDFIGINYYLVDSFSLALGKKYLRFIDRGGPGQLKSDLGWHIYPRGIYHVLKKTARYGKPIYITENGIADARDAHRAKFIKEHVNWMKKAMDEGADVRGYFHWSLLDNFEMPRLDGFWPRFGLVEIDYKTMKRKIRPSAWEYKKIIETFDI